MLTEDAVFKALETVEDPEIHKPITELGMVKSVSIKGTEVTVAVYLTIKACPMRESITSRVENAVGAIEGVTKVNVELDVMSDAQREKLKLQLRGPEREIPFVRPDSKTRVFAIASGKGGVGKSSLTANLAVAFAQKGLSVGIVDADIYGHSIPRILGLTADQTQIDPDLRIPPMAHGIKVLSVLGMKGGDTSRPIALRGPMLGKMLEQFLADFYWGDLDILLLDLPPGTGDIAISTAQLLPNAEIVVVTTPQIAAAEVAIRAGMMATLISQRLAGVIENMSAVNCGKCGEQMALFGEGGGNKVADELSKATQKEVPLLGKVPFDVRIREGGDNGMPLPISNPDAPAATVMNQIVESLLRNSPRSLAGKALKLTN